MSGLKTSSLAHDHGKEPNPYSAGWVRGSLILVWLSLMIGLVVLVLLRDVATARYSFQQHGEHAFGVVREKLVSAETLLVGFAAALDTTIADDYAQAAAYARQVLKSHPKVYAIEAIRRVPNAYLDFPRAFPTHPPDMELQIKTYSYESDRKWAPVSLKKPFYYPIVFLEPPIAEALDIIGLDVDSVDFLAASLEQAAVTGKPVAGKAFRLVEGPLAFAVFTAAGVPDRPDAEPRRYSYEKFAEMIIRADQLINDLHLVLLGNEKLDLHMLSSMGEQDDTVLATVPPNNLPSFLDLWLPELTHKQHFTAMSSYFRFDMSRQMRWSDIDWTLLLALVLFATLFLLLSLRHYQTVEDARQERDNLLYRMANYDSLTGIANRKMLKDRLEQSISQARRQNHRIALIFVDVDGFKVINDNYGHQTGDEVLVEVARRLGDSVRCEDTVARLGGDEFVVLLAQPSDKAMATTVEAKFNASLASPIESQNGPLSVGISLGHAVFPEDGDDPDQLLHTADLAMYRNKQSNAKGDEQS